MKGVFFFLIFYITFKVEAEDSGQVTLDRHNQMLYDEIGKTFLIANLDNKLGFIPCHNNVAVFNLIKGQYVLVNPKTLFAISGQFEDYNPSQQHQIFLRAVQQICEQHPSITIDTPDCFDFQQILKCYYKNQYQWNTIFPNQTNLTANVSTPFVDWFATAKDWQLGGYLKVGFWGFLEAIFQNKAKMALAVVRALKNSYKCFGEFKTEFVSALHKKCKLGLHHVLEFSCGLEDYLSAKSEYSIASTWKWITGTNSASKVITIPFFDKTYTMNLKTIDKQIILRFTIESPTGVDMDNRIIFLPGGLLLFNENCNIAIYFYKRYFVLMNLKTVLTFVGKHNILMKIEGIFLQNSRLVRLTFQEKYAEALEIVRDLTEMTPEGVFPLLKLIEAVKYGQISEVEHIVGKQLAKEVMDFFGKYFKGCTGSFESVIIQVFGNPNQHLTKVCAKIFASIAALGKEWTAFIDMIKSPFNIFG